MLRILIKSAVLLAFLAPPAFAQQLLKVTTIPEEAATEQVRKFGPLTRYLERTLGAKVEFTPVNDYPAAVEALVSGPNLRTCSVAASSGMVVTLSSCCARAGGARKASRTADLISMRSMGSLLV